MWVCVVGHLQCLVNMDEHVHHVMQCICGKIICIILLYACEICRVKISGICDKSLPRGSCLGMKTVGCLVHWCYQHLYLLCVNNKMIHSSAMIVLAQVAIKDAAKCDAL